VAVSGKKGLKIEEVVVTIPMYHGSAGGGRVPQPHARLQTVGHRPDTATIVWDKLSIVCSPLPSPYPAIATRATRCTVRHWSSPSLSIQCASTSTRTGTLCRSFTVPKAFWSELAPVTEPVSTFPCNLVPNNAHC